MVQLPPNAPGPAPPPPAGYPPGWRPPMADPPKPPPDRPYTRAEHRAALLAGASWRVLALVFLRPRPRTVFANWWPRLRDARPRPEETA